MHLAIGLLNCPKIDRKSTENGTEKQRVLRKGPGGEFGAFRDPKLHKKTLKIGPESTPGANKMIFAKSMFSSEKWWFRRVAASANQPKLAKNRRKNGDRKKTAKFSPNFWILTDFGAILGAKNGPKFGKKRCRKNGRKKGRKKHLEPNLGPGFGGLRTAAGEVRRGSPSGYGGIPAKISGRIPRWFKHAKHPGGVRRI